jgi:hypothetical protein
MKKAIFLGTILLIFGGFYSACSAYTLTVKRPVGGGGIINPDPSWTNCPAVEVSIIIEYKTKVSHQNISTNPASVTINEGEHVKISANVYKGGPVSAGCQQASHSVEFTAPAQNVTYYVRYSASTQTVTIGP